MSIAGGRFCEGQLAAFRVVDVYGQLEATCHFTKLHPDYVRAYPLYALIHRMNEYYLAEEGFQYVNSGWRTMRHETHIQSTLVEHFGYRRAYSNLSLHCRPALAFFLKATYPLQGLLGRLNPRLAALYALAHVHKSCAASACPQPAA